MLTKRLKMLRAEAGLTQGELANKIGVSAGKVSHLENGVREPNLRDLHEISKFFKVSIDYLLGNSQTRVPYEPETIAAHKDGVDWSDEELEAIENFKEMVRKLRKKED